MPQWLSKTLLEWSKQTQMLYQSQMKQILLFKAKKLRTRKWSNTAAAAAAVVVAEAINTNT